MTHLTAAYVTTLVPNPSRHTVGANDNALPSWRKRRIAIRELRALDDHTLNDIGLSRSQIPAVVDGLLDQSGTVA